MNTDNTLPLPLSRLGPMGLIVGVIGLLGSVIAALTAMPEFLHAYVYAFVFWVSLTLGCFGFLLLHNMVRGSWGLTVLRLFEAGAKNLPWMFLPFAILMFFLPKIYPWANPEHMNEEVYRHRHIWMNAGFFFVRGVIFFGTWTLLVNFLTKSSRIQDENHNPVEEQKRANVAAGGFVWFVLSITLAFTDWVMSLNGPWYSTIYGAWWMISGGLNAMALVTLIATRMRLAKREPYYRVITPAVTKDFGNLLLMLCMVWAYFSVSQWLIIWSGNLPEEIVYYLNRFHGGYLYIGASLIFAQFFGPFVVLLSGRTKRVPNYLASVALWIIIVRIVDVYWQVMPAFPNERTSFNFWVFFPWMAIGGFWMAGFIAHLKQNLLLPTYDPRLNEVNDHA